jgi:hypothetical protein
VNYDAGHIRIRRFDLTIEALPRFGTEVPMINHRTIAAFVAVALLAAATTAAAMRPQAPNAAQREFAVATAPKPVIKKPVRYEAIISNWKRYRSGAKSSG